MPREIKIGAARKYDLASSYAFGDGAQKKEMQKVRLILDIRHYESSHQNIDGASLPSELGKVFKFPGSVLGVGARIARKLREIGFTAVSFDHVYINFTSCFDSGKVGYSPRSVHREDSWLRYIDYGLAPTNLEILPDSEKYALFCSATFKVLRFIAKEKPSEVDKIDQVENLLRIHGPNLDILHKNKIAKNYETIVKYRISSERQKGSGWVRYLDKTSNVVRESCFIELKSYEDILFLVSDVVVKGDYIVFKPRASFKAQLYNDRYSVPLMIKIQDMPIVANAEST